MVYEQNSDDFQIEKIKIPKLLKGKVRKNSYFTSKILCWRCQKYLYFQEPNYERCCLPCYKKSLEEKKDRIQMTINEVNNIIDNNPKYRRILTLRGLQDE